MLCSNRNFYKWLDNEFKSHKILSSHKNHRNFVENLKTKFKSKDFLSKMVKDELKTIKELYL
jgi:hypothetical protein